MQTVDISADDTTLSQLVDAATAGEEVLFARDGRPVARLVAVPVPAMRAPRQLGTLAGRLGHIPDDFDAPLPDDFLDAFERK
jgi:antitoxin (DNA-binding transcriptional repressor) of toxin-antitoxin stability system